MQRYVQPGLEITTEAVRKLRGESNAVLRYDFTRKIGNVPPLQRGVEVQFHAEFPDRVDVVRVHLDLINHHGRDRRYRGGEKSSEADRAKEIHGWRAGRGRDGLVADNPSGKLARLDPGR